MNSEQQLPLRRSNRISSSNSNSTIVDSKPKISECPFIEFGGKIKYFTTKIDIACACDELITWIDTVHKDSKIVPLAFDMEWPFSYQTGPGRSSVIQICLEEHEAYVFSIGELKKLPSALMVLLLHPKTLLHGVNIKNDFRKLQRDYPDTNSDKLIEKSLDLAFMCNEVRNTSGKWSLERLANYVCRLQMDKSNSVRMSKWNVIPLNPVQLKYAAIDVYIGQVIYNKLDKERGEKTEEDYQNEVLLKKLNLF